MRNQVSGWDEGWKTQPGTDGLVGHSGGQSLGGSAFEGNTGNQYPQPHDSPMGSEKSVNWDREIPDIGDSLRLIAEEILALLRAQGPQTRLDMMSP